MACSTVFEYSQQEGFYRVPLPPARQTPNLEDQWLERSNSRHQVSLTSETPAAEGGTMDEKMPRILPKVVTSTSLLGSFTCRKFTTWDRRLYFPSEGRHAEDFFARKIRRLRPGLNSRTWVPKASTLTPRPPKPLCITLFDIIHIYWLEFQLHKVSLMYVMNPNQSVKKKRVISNRRDNIKSFKTQH